MKKYLLSFYLIIPFFASFAGGIKGTVKADDGTVLPFTSIYIKQTASGAATDLNGYYEITLPAGRYELIYKFLGYESVNRVVDVADSFVEVNVTLKQESVVLATVTVKASKEDPAYTIMRKAIAKAKYHTQQLDSYTFHAYIKGKGKATDVPRLLRKTLEKEGFAKDVLFITESVSEIKYTRPDKWEEKVIAVYTRGGGKDKNVSPNSFIKGSFYDPSIGDFVSPLSPKAFSYYRFEYQGTFKDGKYDVSKIKVIPRSKGDKVFEGVISIVENWWSIHSLDLGATALGFHFQIKQIYNPIDDKAWLPLSFQFEVGGKIFGFGGELNYLAVMKGYKIKLNPALPVEMEVIDEKLEKEEAKKIKKEFSQKNQQLKQRLESGKEITNKELKQLVKAYEKEEQKHQKEPDVISESKYTIDSMAYKKDSTYWLETRPMALDKEEIRGYKKTDSISEVQRKREEGDTLKSKKKHKGFSPGDVLTGNTYALNKTSSFQIHMPRGGYNTVEGAYALYRLSYFKRWVKQDSTDKDKRPETRRLEISPYVRYAFAREKFSGYLKIDYRTRRSNLRISGGRYIQQFNSNEPIFPFINTITTLVQGQNWMKIYERDFVEATFRQIVKSKYTFTSGLSLARRYQLFDKNNYSFNEKSKERFTPNAPTNVELPSTDFADNTTFVGRIGIEARPWQKFRIRNGVKYRSERSSPILSANYQKGFSGFLGSDVDYDLIEVGVRDGIRFGIRGTLDFNLNAGKFLNTKSMYFMDYKHFMGNQTPIITTDPTSSFRLLDYYKYSTRDEYFSGIVHYHFRKFIVSRIPKARLLGVTENFFVSYLATPSSGNYTELGYGINGILRLFRVEFATSFQNGNYVNNGFRLGFSSNLSVRFSDN